ncbi:MAG: S9 family peptidase [Candidatus Koribacter versatilis]|uniref:S9 family peptidase n=1 Tax=Candidatus Korobacter versatilis TaxID=658062 RepID=A0A932A8T9_9BACT|nr:S9 family peptidase [Candidatus Koribacter versatilis]
MKTTKLLLGVLLLALCAPAFSQTAAPTAQPQAAATLKPYDNLVVENVPPIPMSVVEDVARYTEYRTAGFRSWHPTKRELLIGTRFADVPQVHRVATPGGARAQLTFYPDRVGGGTYEPRRGSYFVFSKDKSGDEFFQFYRYDVATGNVTLLSDGKSRNTGFQFSTDGNRAVYGSTRRNNDDVDLYVIDPKDPKSDRMLAELKGGGWGALDWSEDDKKIAVLEEISANESYIWLVDAATGQKEMVTPKAAEKIYYGGAIFSKDGKGLYVTTDKEGEFQRLAYVDLATKKHTYLTSRIPWDAQSFDLSRDGKTIAFVTNENGIGKLHLLDVASGKEKAVPPLPSGTIGSATWHENNVDLAFDMDSAQSPNDVYSLNVRTGKVDRWTTSETGGVLTTDLQEPELMKWKSFDGMEISGFLYKPAAKFTGKRPVMINIHGGPEGQSTPGFLGRSNYYLKELGVAILYPNVRGSSGYGKTFLAMDNGFNREKSYWDIGALLDYIKTRPDLDSERVFIIGGSYGGFMSLQVSTHYSDKICCSVDIVGISNLVTFLENTSGYRRDLRRVEYGDERDPKMRAFMERIAAVNNADKIKKPTFVVQGFNDPRVPRTEAMQMVQKIRSSGTPVWFLMASDEGHGFAKKKNADYLFYSTVMFMKEFLLK